MAIKISGITVIDDSRNIQNIGVATATTFVGALTGTASNVTTNANLTGDVTSVGNATAIAAGVIVDADINASAGIVDTKLATISTAGKVSNSATTATNANTASAIVARDASGNFSAGTITASLTGNAATATNVAYGGLTGAVPTWNQNTTGSAGSVDFNNLTSKASGSGTYTTSGDFRAPIFYDSNNTAYYTDPASTSNFNRIQSSQIYGNTEFAASDNSSTSYSVASIELRESQFGGSSGYLAPRISWHWGGVVASQIGMESSGRITVLNNPGSGYEALIGSILYGNDSVRAPIFYDSNNTAYYTDPASTSNLNGLTVAGDTRVSGVVTAFDFYSDAEYPNIRPTLDLAFAETKILDSRITFTRASTATYVNSVGILTTAAVNQPRFDHNPTTGESLGLLVEEARTNLWTNSDNPTFTAVNGSITSTTEISPAGTATASKFVPAAASDSTDRFIVIPQSNTLSTTQVVSFFVKTDYSYLVFCANGQGSQINVNVNVGINLTTDTVYQTITANGSYFSTTVTGFPSGWKRISISYSTDGGIGGKQPGIIVSDTQFTILGNPGRAADQTANYVTDGIKSLTIWGVQCETGSFPTSYIATTSSTVTRAADVASMTGTNFSSWYNQDQGTLAVTTPSGIVTPAVSNQSYFGISTGALAAALSTGNGFKYGNGNPNTSTRLFVIAASATQVDNNSATNASKIAFAYAANNFALARGQSLFTDTSGNVPTGMDTFTIRGVGSQSYSRLTYYPVRLPDAQLQTITL